MNAPYVSPTDVGQGYNPVYGSGLGTVASANPSKKSGSDIGFYVEHPSKHPEILELSAGK